MDGGAQFVWHHSESTQYSAQQRVHWFSWWDHNSFPGIYTSPKSIVEGDEQQIMRPALVRKMGLSEAKVNGDLSSVMDMQVELWYLSASQRSSLDLYEWCQFSWNIGTDWLVVRRIVHHELEIQRLQCYLWVWFFPFPVRICLLMKMSIILQIAVVDMFISNASSLLLIASNECARNIQPITVDVWLCRQLRTDQPSLFHIWWAVGLATEPLLIIFSHLVYFSCLLRLFLSSLHVFLFKTCVFL